MAKQTDLFEATGADVPLEDLASTLLNRGGGDLDSALLDVDSSDGGESQQANIPFLERDPAVPFEDKRLERFLRLIADGKHRCVAYWEAASSKCSRKSALEQASRWLRVPENVARLNFLRREKMLNSMGRGGMVAGGQDGGLAVPGGTGNKPGSAQGRVSLSSREGLIAAFDDIVRTSMLDPNKANVTMNGLQQIAKLRGFIRDPNDAKKDKIDPATLCAFLKRAQDAGMDPEELARKEKDEPYQGDAQDADPGADSGPVGDFRDDAPLMAPDGSDGGDWGADSDGGAQDVGGVHDPA